MTMGHKEQMVNGDEYDYLTKEGREMSRPSRAGKFKTVKKSFNKRIRKISKMRIKNNMDLL